MPVQFAVLASGSRGNATLIQTGGAGVLLDLGLGPRALAQRLESVGASWGHVYSALLTHTHGDHVDNATMRLMARKQVSLYCHEGHRGHLAGLSGFQALDAAGLIRHYDERPFLGPAGMRVEPVELSHDGGPTFGFRVEVKPGRGCRPVALGYLADTGCWSDAMADAVQDVDLLGVEFNHDVHLQKTSGRAPALVARNLGDRGHLSNEQGVEFVLAVLDRSHPRTVRHLVLLHLSQQCNRPILALRTARAALRGKGRRVNVHAALQSPAHPNLWVEPARRSASARRLADGEGPAVPGETADDGWQMADDKCQIADGKCQMADDRGQTADDRGQVAEEGCRVEEGGMAEEGCQTADG